MMYRHNLKVDVSTMALVFAVVVVGILVGGVRAGVVGEKYNLIDTEPSCLGKGICDYADPSKPNNEFMSVFPNAEERAQMQFINIARMTPQDFLRKYGKYEFGLGGPLTRYYSGQANCGVPQAKPLYWHTGANQAARFNQWDCAKCSGDCGHSTCETRCYLFGGCDFGRRANAFVDDVVANAEGLCGAQMCFTSGHCGAMFEPGSEFIGIGFYADGTRNGITNVYTATANAPSPNYPIPMVSHIDERIKVNSDLLRSDGKYLAFLAQYWSPDQSASNGWLYYDGKKHEMSLLYGTTRSGTWVFHATVPDECEPYFFEFRMNNGSMFRMPQDEKYVFGTSWNPWAWWTPSKPCRENHYYLKGNEYQANAGPNRNGPSSSSGCIGCSKISALVSSPTPQPVAPPVPSPTPQPVAPPGGTKREVTVRIPGSNKILTLCEVQVFAMIGSDKVEQLLTLSEPSQSSIYENDEANFGAFKAIDGNTNGNMRKQKTCTHTLQSTNPEWSAKIPANSTPVRIILHNRSDCCQERIIGAQVYIDNTLVGTVTTKYQRHEFTTSHYDDTIIWSESTCENKCSSLRSSRACWRFNEHGCQCERRRVRGRKRCRRRNSA